MKALTLIVWRYSLFSCLIVGTSQGFVSKPTPVWNRYWSDIWVKFNYSLVSTLTHFILRTCVYCIYVVYTVYNILFTVYSICSKQYTVYSIQYTVYCLLYTVYSIYSILYTVYRSNAMNSLNFELAIKDKQYNSYSW